MLKRKMKKLMKSKNRFFFFFFFSWRAHQRPHRWAAKRAAAARQRGVERPLRCCSRDCVCGAERRGSGAGENRQGPGGKHDRGRNRKRLSSLARKSVCENMRYLEENGGRKMRKENNGEKYQNEGEGVSWNENMASIGLFLI